MNHCGASSEPVHENDIANSGSTDPGSTCRGSVISSPSLPDAVVRDSDKENYPLVEVSLHEWKTCKIQAEQIRRCVFINEQGVSPEIEQDGLDGKCLHALARYGQQVVGTARLRPEGCIGRMAVLKAFRGKGVGSRLLLALIEAAAKRGADQVYLAAQEHAIPFYLRHGFVPEGQRFYDAGMPHVMMRRLLG